MLLSHTERHLSITLYRLNIHTTEITRLIILFQTFDELHFGHPLYGFNSLEKSEPKYRAVLTTLVYSTGEYEQQNLI